MELFHTILMSADTYHLFAKEMRPKLKEENPNLSLTELPKNWGYVGVPCRMVRRPSTRVKEGCSIFLEERRKKGRCLGTRISLLPFYPKVLQHTPGRRRAEIARARRQHKLLGTRYF